MKVLVLGQAIKMELEILMNQTPLVEIQAMMEALVQQVLVVEMDQVLELMELMGQTPLMVMEQHLALKAMEVEQTLLLVLEALVDQALVV